MELTRLLILGYQLAMPKILNVPTSYFDHFTGLSCSSTVHSIRPQQPELLSALHA
jgi:hypothetical protein